jgi:ubiquinone/menaquinone biosynthesis C-methylase UbiE
MGTPRQPARPIPGQFRQPHGDLGRVVGVSLALFHARLNREAVRFLAPAPNARALEIGFGPGVGLRELLGQIPSGRVAGIDPSDVMHRQASRRNRRALVTGRLELVVGTARELPWPSGSFDAILSLNNVLLWNPLDRSVGETFRILRPGGVIVVGLHEMAARGESPEGSGSLSQVLSVLRTAFEGAGYGELVPRIVKVPVGRALLVRAVKPAPAGGPPAVEAARETLTPRPG